MQSGIGCIVSLDSNLSNLSQKCPISNFCLALMNPVMLTHSFFCCHFLLLTLVLHFSSSTLIRIGCFKEDSFSAGLVFPTPHRDAYKRAPYKIIMLCDFLSCCTSVLAWMNTVYWSPGIADTHTLRWPTVIWMSEKMWFWVWLCIGDVVACLLAASEW